MTHRLTILLLMVCSISLGSKSYALTPDNRPNIILVFVDDMGWGDFSCFGNTEARTPHIDSLASEGIRFEQFYVNSPICSPSRTAISTGQYPQRWQITSYLAHRKTNTERGMAQWLNPRAPMLARHLAEAGIIQGTLVNGTWGDSATSVTLPPLQTTDSKNRLPISKEWARSFFH